MRDRTLAGAWPAVIVGLGLGAVLCTACGPGRSDPATGQPARVVASPEGGADWFVDVTSDAGLDVVYVNGMSGELSMAEVLGPGVALLDYDDDGDLDVYVVQGGALGVETGSPDRPPVGDRLFRNDLGLSADGRPALQFTDVTVPSGIAQYGYGMGATAGDYDGDGWVDLYVTNFGPNTLLHNNGDGTFADVSKSSGTADPSWSVSAAFLDFDRDGWLDLYVGNYLRYDPTSPSNTVCFAPSGARDYCTPEAYPAQPDRLYRNRGDGTFQDVTTRAGLGRAFGPALGVATADYDGDGWIDVYVANDGQDNQLWLNQRDGTFRDGALLAGAAVSAAGHAEGSMGVDAGDFDNDGDEDLFMTHLTGEGHNLYVNDGRGVFTDQSTSSGLGPASLAYTGFGTAWVDVDNDGWLDLLTVDGTVRLIQALVQAGDPVPLRQRKQLFRNLGDGRFEDISDRGGAVFELSEVGRGAAFGDLDNDGDMDVVVANNDGPMRLLLNRLEDRPGKRHWVGLRLLSGDPPRDALGARVEIVRPRSRSLWRRARADGSYGSSNDPRVLVGLGESTLSPTASVTWPDGRQEQWTDVPLDRWTVLEQGHGGSVPNEAGADTE